MEAKQGFWVVWCRFGGPPTVLHSERETARREAERLADQNPGKEFYVLRAESVSVHRTVVTTCLAEPEIPF